MGRTLVMTWMLFNVAWVGLALYTLFARPDWLVALSQQLGRPVSFQTPLAWILIVAVPVGVGLLLWGAGRVFSRR